MTAVEKKYTFTRRELDIIQWLKHGKKSSEIGEILSISKHTVDTHRRKILKKAGCANTIELISKLIRS